MTLFDSDSEPADGKGEKPERAGCKLVAVVVSVLVLLVAGGYVAAHAVAGDKVPLGTSISGVDVGGMAPEAAVKKVEKAFAGRDEAEIAVTVERRLPGESGGNGATIKPADIGLAVDARASVEAAGAGDSWSPGRQWDYFTGGDDVDAVVTLDEDALTATLAELSEGLGTPPVDGQVIFSASGVETAPPESGEAVDPDAALAALTEAYLEGKDAVTLSVVKAEPEIDQADVDEALKSFATPAMAAPITLVFGKSEIVLAPKKFAKVLSMEPQDGVLVPVVDQDKLTALVRSATTDGKPVDASVEVVKGKVRVVPAKPGVTFKPEDVKTVFEGLLTKPADARSGAVTAQVTDADFTTKDAQDLKIVEKISEFRTHYPHAEYRNVNIGRAAVLIDGTILKPGDTFSLNGIVGERTVENGFTSGYIISNGILRKDLGGGVSQMATTAFNAAFFAGLEDVEHKPHSFYIDRYPVGREATVAWPTVDLKFKNDSPYGVLVNAWVKPSTYSSQGEVVVQLWSTKVWDIEAKASNRYAYVSPATRTLSGPDCEAHSGWSGFQIDVTRIFRKHGESAVDHREKFHTVYTPSDTVVCEAPPKPGKPPKPGQD